MSNFCHWRPFKFPNLHWKIVLSWAVRISLGLS
jgi:hypothetical protein